MNDFEASCDECTQVHPNNPVANISMAMKHLPTDKEKSMEAIEGIDPEKIHPVAIGQYGRLLLIHQHIKEGVTQLQRIAGTPYAIPIDYYKLITSLLMLDEPQAALQIYTSHKIQGSKLEKRILHANIRLHTTEYEQCIAICEEILIDHPAENRAIDCISKCRAKLSYPT